MAKIEQEGLYKGTIRDFGVNMTRKAKLPQFIATFLVTERYNEATEEWEDWSEYQLVMPGYFVLVRLNEQGNVVKCLNYDQVIAAVGWDGETYSSLAALELKGMEVQFRVAEEIYNDEAKMKITWLDAADADVGLTKLTTQALTDLDSKFGIAGSGKPQTAAKPKGDAAKKKTAPKGAGKKSPPKAPKPPKAEKVETPEAETETPSEPCSEKEAYDACFTLNEGLNKPVPQEVLDQYWLKRAIEIAVNEDEVTDEEWGKIKVAVMSDIEIPF